MYFEYDRFNDIRAMKETDDCLSLILPKNFVF